jgi:tRNA pseudouridine55 synthase
VVALVRRLSGMRRVGHGGTLDPFASGVLPIFLGKATRVVEFHLGARKRYRATVCFGASSTTDDLEGELTPSDGQAPTRTDVEAALPAFRGEISQRPPAYSAIKVGGRRAYAMARAGEAPTLAARTVTIDELTLVSWDDADPSRPIAVVDVACSAGTYIRALARDLGEELGSGAYLGALERTQSGPFTLADATSLDAIREAAAKGSDMLRGLLRPIDAGLEDLPIVHVNAAERDAVIRGQFVRPSSGLPAGVGPDVVVRVVDASGALIALARVAGARLAPDKVLVDIGPTQAPRDAAVTPAPRSARSALSARSEMRVVAGVDALAADDGPLFVVVGVFDGLHRGHAYLLDALVREAAKRDAKPTVITFDAHPDEIILGTAPPILCDPDERLVRLAEAGVQVAVVQHFDRALRMTPYDDFVAMIERHTRLAGFLMTPDAAFGHERGGTADALADLGAKRGFEVVVVPPFQVAGREVRSSDIRALIATGDLAGASALLGRPYAVVGGRSAAEEGSLAGPRRETLTFALPVALPPAGTYAGSVGPAPVLGESAAEPAKPFDATIVVPSDQQWLELRAETDLPAGDRDRVTFTP